MRLSESSRKLAFGNIDLLKYCNSVCIDTNKLEECNIEKMGDLYIFVMSKNTNGIDTKTCLLEHDIATQPDIVLTMEYNKEKKTFEFETTEYTKRILRL
ncbi:MAG: hypothetical protein K1W30_14740 [Lachnospiraceae bacterium]